ncbi:mucin-5AC [Lucilia sericata]|uniref:mucin-5AC n=1 Tax=Lucilia sericata TaxID=13632 RepID=UPI0018A832F2|nr:mucin-5AC [Lucilia sericata]
MLRINLYICMFICAIVLTITNTVLGQESSFLRKPWPTYSLQNMPQTRFTCHDKILGGYYADPEAQCQMFHVCVKVAGVGVQDFRFLCPNGTAFDQEAQICADWGDVDCEQSVLYYGSDNFDLYRLGSGFESKRAPLAEEDESTFHLQRAESGDVRRFKETRIDQKSRPDQPPNYTKHFETVTRGTFNSNSNSNHNNNNNNYVNTQQQQQQHVKTKKQKQPTEVTKKPIVSYYTPTSTTTTTTERNYNDDSKQDLDDIFKGSHSSHFFSNRNGGREDDFLDHPVKPSLKPNDFSDFSKKSEASTIGKSRVTPTRPKRPLQTTTTTLASTTTTTAAPKTAKKVTQHSYYNTDFYDFTPVRSTTSASTSFSTTLVTTPRPLVQAAQSNANRFNIGFNDYQTQAKIQPTTYNPNRYKPTTTKYTEFKRDKAETGVHNKATGNTKKAQKFEQTQQKLNPQNSTFVKYNEFNDFAKIKTQPPQPFQPQPPAKIFEAPAKTSAEPQFYRSRGQARINNQQPEPFRAPQRQTVKPTEKVKEKPTVAVKADVKPRGFVSRGSINYKATTQRDSDTYPTTTSNNHKKFSTLVPKDKYAPTTFKPSTYKKTYDSNYYQNQQTIRPSNQPQKTQTTATSTTIYTTPNPYYNPDEDDGQYHPELYEIDYSRNNFNRQRHTSSPTTTSTTSTTTTTQKPFKQNYHNPVNHLKSQQQTSYIKEQTAAADFSEEDELFKTAQSLNFGAASINKLRADIFKAEKTSQQYNSQYNPHNSITSPKTTTTSTPISTTTTYFTYPSYSTTTQTTSRPTTYIVPSTTTTTTTRRPTTTTNSPTKYTTAYPLNITKSGKHADKLEKKLKKNENKNKKKTSKRPAHADEDTSYDYAYYDSDTLSESPQEYPEYEIQEFTKTKRN